MKVSTSIFSGLGSILVLAPLAASFPQLVVPSNVSITARQTTETYYSPYGVPRCFKGCMDDGAGDPISCRKLCRTKPSDYDIKPPSPAGDASDAGKGRRDEPWCHGGEVQHAVWRKGRMTGRCVVRGQSKAGGWAGGQTYYFDDGDVEHEWCALGTSETAYDIDGQKKKACMIPSAPEEKQGPWSGGATWYYEDGIVEHDCQKGSKVMVDVLNGRKQRLCHVWDKKGWGKMKATWYYQDGSIIRDPEITYKGANRGHPVDLPSEELKRPPFETYHSPYAEDWGAPWHPKRETSEYGPITG